MLSLSDDPLRVLVERFAPDVAEQRAPLSHIRAVGRGVVCAVAAINVSSKTERTTTRIIDWYRSASASATCAMRVARRWSRSERSRELERYAGFERDVLSDRGFRRQRIRARREAVDLRAAAFARQLGAFRHRLTASAPESSQTTDGTTPR